MESIRSISKIWKSEPTLEGAGVHLKRAFGYNQVPLFDPFLLLDDFHSDNPRHYLKGFPWHPHRGIETITYALQGRVEHGDSMGNKGVIDSGDVQWMTAGSGIIHQEMPKGNDGGLLWGFQATRDAYAREMVGRNYFDTERRCVCGAEDLVLYGDGDSVAVTTEGGKARFLLVSGKPLGEPVAWYGPIVMNTRDELRVAFEEYEDGTFVKR